MCLVVDSDCGLGFYLGLLTGIPTCAPSYDLGLLTIWWLGFKGEELRRAR